MRYQLEKTAREILSLAGEGNEYIVVGGIFLLLILVALWSVNR